ncbi:MAG: hypothetical protein RIR70_1658 [Pseudomonadota bacterium]|jgi:hypothetical protein
MLAASECGLRITVSRWEAMMSGVDNPRYRARASIPAEPSIPWPEVPRPSSRSFPPGFSSRRRPEPPRSGAQHAYVPSVHATRLKGILKSSDTSSPPRSHERRVRFAEPAAPAAAAQPVQPVQPVQKTRQASRSIWGKNPVVTRCLAAVGIISGLCFAAIFLPPLIPIPLLILGCWGWVEWRIIEERNRTHLAAKEAAKHVAPKASQHTAQQAIASESRRSAKHARNDAQAPTAATSLGDSQPMASSLQGHAPRRESWLTAENLRRHRAARPDFSARSRTATWVVESPEWPLRWPAERTGLRQRQS